jgi:hypothetical protein
MRIQNWVLVLLSPLILEGCAKVPTEVKTAMEKQAEELKQIKAAYKDSVDALFAQVRTLQLYILNEKEKEFQQRYARGPKVVTLEDKKTQVVVYTDSDGKPLPPSGNVNTDLIALSTNRLISDWFAKKRADTEQQLLVAKEEFMKLQGHIEIAQQINQAVSEYVDSLVNLSKQQKELGSNLTKRLSVLPGAATVQKTLISLLIPDTSELEKTLPK